MSIWYRLHNKLFVTRTKHFGKWMRGDCQIKRWSDSWRVLAVWNDQPKCIFYWKYLNTQSGGRTRNHQIKYQFAFAASDVFCKRAHRERKRSAQRNRGRERATPPVKCLFIFHMDCGLGFVFYCANKSENAIQTQNPYPETSIQNEMKCRWDVSFSGSNLNAANHQPKRRKYQQKQMPFNLQRINE